MRSAYAASFAVAVLCHAFLLFGFRLGTSAVPLALSDEPSPVDVTLVASAPEAPAAQPPPPQPSPTPEPPAPEPTPEMSTPPPEPAQTPIPEIAPAPESSREIPPPRPRAQKPGRPVTAPTLKNGARPGVSTRGPVGTAVRYRSNPKPEYPDEARHLRQEGVVLLNVEVTVDGRAADVSLKRSSGFPVLDEAAIQAVKRWTFEPARVDSLPVPSRVEVPIRFSLSQ